MKIAILTYGHFASIMPLAKEMARKHDVTLYLVVHGQRFTESVGTLEMEQLSLGVHGESETRKLLEPKLNAYLGESLKVKLVKYPNLKVNNYENYRVSRQCAMELNREKFEFVHFNGIKFFQFVIYFLLRRKKAAWTIHDPFLHSGEQQKDTVILYKVLSRLGIHLFLHNRHYLEEFISTYHCKASKVHFLPYAPLEIFGTYRNPALVPEQSTVLFFGRISKYKGIEYLIEAARIAQKSIPGLKVIIAGTGVYPIDLESLKSDPLFDIQYRHIPNEELVQFIQRSTVIACPYTDATQSGVVMTAYALSKPVIATSVGGLPEVVKDHETGLLIPPKDSEALAKAIVEILSDPALPGIFSKNIERYYVEGELSWKAASEKLTSVYKAILGKQ